MKASRLIIAAAISVASIAGYTQAVSADVSEEFIRHKSKNMWAGFVCAALADASGDREGSQRYFQFAYMEGQISYDLVERYGYMNTSLDLKVVPFWFGPTADFVIGRTAQGAYDFAKVRVFTDEIASKEFENPNKGFAREQARRLLVENSCDEIDFRIGVQKHQKERQKAIQALSGIKPSE